MRSQRGSQIAWCGIAEEIAAEDVPVRTFMLLYGHVINRRHSGAPLWYQEGLIALIFKGLACWCAVDALDEEGFLRKEYIIRWC